MYADNRRTNEFLGMVGRLRRGVSVDQASRDMMAFAESLKHDFKDSYPTDWSIHTRALSEQGKKTVRPALLDCSARSARSSSSPVPISPTCSSPVRRGVHVSSPCGRR